MIMITMSLGLSFVYSHEDIAQIELAKNIKELLHSVATPEGLKTVEMRQDGLFMDVGIPLSQMISGLTDQKVLADIIRYINANLSYETQNKIKWYAPLPFLDLVIPSDVQTSISRLSFPERVLYIFIATKPKGDMVVNDGLQPLYNNFPRNIRAMLKKNGFASQEQY